MIDEGEWEGRRVGGGDVWTRLVSTMRFFCIKFIIRHMAEQTPEH